MLNQALAILISALAGAVAGNAVGALRGRASLGPTFNTLLGAAGGVAATIGLGAGGHARTLTMMFAENPFLAASASGMAGGFFPPLIAAAIKRGS